MLSAGDLQVARRDPGIPALALVLDDHALSDWLSRRLDQDVRARGRYLRYKPGTSCVVQVDVLRPQHRGPLIVCAYGRESFVKMTKTLKVVRPDDVLVSDLRLGVLVATPTADRDLPGLGRLLHDASWRSRLLRQVLPGWDGSERGPVLTLRYKPGRRWVGRLSPPEGSDVVLRVYPPAQVQAVADAVAAWAGGEPRCPALLGLHAGRGVVAVEYVEGTVLSDLHGRSQLDQVWRAGAALARLHGRADVVLTVGGPMPEGSAALTAGRYLAHLLPEMAQEVDDLAQAVADRLAVGPRESAALHGDFSIDQAVLTPTGDVALIDLDVAHRGDPAVDLACAAAAMATDAAIGAAPVRHAARQREALYAGYASVRSLPDPDRLAVREAEHLLRRAVEPFRLRLCGDWPAATRALVGQARQSIGATTVSGGVP